MAKNSLRVPVLNTEYAVVVCWGTPKEITRVLHRCHYPKNERLDSDAFNVRGMCFYHRGCHPVIALPDIPVAPVEIGTLAHEAVHAVSSIMETIGADSWNDEVVAHSVGAVVRSVLSHVARNKKGESIEK
jgi:hypothetical protein